MPSYNEESLVSELPAEACPGTFSDWSSAVWLCLASSCCISWFSRCNLVTSSFSPCGFSVVSISQRDLAWSRRSVRGNKPLPRAGFENIQFWTCQSRAP